MRVTDEQIAKWRELAQMMPATANDILDALEAERATAAFIDQKLRELLIEQRRRTEVAEELLRRSDNNLSRVGEECAHLQTTRARQGKRIMGLLEQSARRLERISKLRAELRWHRTTGNCGGAA